MLECYTGPGTAPHLLRATDEQGADHARNSMCPTIRMFSQGKSPIADVGSSAVTFSRMVSARIAYVAYATLPSAFRWRLRWRSVSRCQFGRDNVPSDKEKLRLCTVANGQRRRTASQEGAPWAAWAFMQVFKWTARVRSSPAVIAAATASMARHYGRVHRDTSPSSALHCVAATSPHSAVGRGTRVARRRRVRCRTGCAGRSHRCRKPPPDIAAR
jgi:hypothetical protein